MELITKTLDLIKASGWQNAMLSIGAWLYIWASRKGHVPELEGGWIAVAHVFAFATGALALASVGGQLQRVCVHLLDLGKAWFKRRAAQKQFERKIELLDDRERQIFGYLLHNRQQAFQVAADGGYAAKLIAQGFVIRIAASGGQLVDYNDVPVKVPDYIWEVLERRKADFPHRPEYAPSRGRAERVEMHPWRIPWGVR